MTQRDEIFDLERLRQGDPAEFARLVDTYAPRLYRLALKMVRQPQDAEDVLQEAFLKAYQALPQFDGRSRLSTWLYRITVNEALMLLRRKHPETVSLEAPRGDAVDDEEQEGLEIVDWCCLPEDELLSAEARAVMEEAIAQLSPPLRAVFLLRDVEGLSTRETAEALGINEGAVKVRLSRARAQLRQALTAYFAPRVRELEEGA